MKKVIETLRFKMVKKNSHEENRLLVCAACGKKIVFGKRRDKNLINQEFEQKIIDLINPNYKRSDNRFPLGICFTCRFTLNEHKSKKTARSLPKMPNFLELVLPRTTRANSDNDSSVICNCFICLTARYKGHVKADTGRGHVRNLDIQITPSTGLYGNSRNTSLTNSNKKSDSKEASTSMKICTKCFQQIGKGIPHSCKSHSEASSNILNLINNLPEKQQEQVATSILSQKIDAQSDSSSISSHQNVSLSLSTSGSKMRVVVNPKEKKT